MHSFSHKSWGPCRRDPFVFWKICRHRGPILKWLPTSQTVKVIFLYSTVSIWKPTVGMVGTVSASFNLYKMVVFPAVSKPNIRIRISFFPSRLLTSFSKMFPIVIEFWAARPLLLNLCAPGRAERGPCVEPTKPPSVPRCSGRREGKEGTAEPNTFPQATAALQFLARRRSGDPARS